METNNQNNLTKKERRELKRKEKEQTIEETARKKRVKNFTIWGIIGAVLISGVSGIVFYAAKGGLSGTGNGNTSLLALAANDWTLGNKEAKTVLIEYSDFQCPACAMYSPIVEKLSKDYENNLTIIYRHFPLPQHKNAKIAAYSAEAAGKQGKFWETALKIFEGQKNWSEAEANEAKEYFKKIAAELSLNMEQFENDMNNNDEIKKSVDDDYISGTALRVNATPTFFLNGKKITPRNYEDFKKMIEEVNK